MADGEMVADAINVGLLSTFDQSILVVDADIVALAIVEGLLVTPVQSTDPETLAEEDTIAEEDIVAEAILLGLFCTFDQSIDVVDAEIVAEAIVLGLF